MNLLKTTFYDEFACIGAECPLTCCGGWMIAMEEKTLKELYSAAAGYGWNVPDAE